MNGIDLGEGKRCLRCNDQICYCPQRKIDGTWDWDNQTPVMDAINASKAAALAAKHLNGENQG